MVLQHNATLRQHSLLPVVLCGFQPSILEKLLNGRFGGLVHHQRLAADLSRGLLGQIILRRPQTSRQDHHVTAAKGRPKWLGQPLLIVSNHCLEIAGQPQRSTLFRQIRSVGVHDAPKQKLCAHEYQFNSHTLLISDRPSRPCFSTDNLSKI